VEGEAALSRWRTTRNSFESDSINLSYRITIEFLIEDRTIIPVNVGPHDSVY